MNYVKAAYAAARQNPERSGMKRPRKFPILLILTAIGSFVGALVLLSIGGTLEIIGGIVLAIILLISGTPLMKRLGYLDPNSPTGGDGDKPE
ncbi:MAG: hypothetical protein JWN01_800 [Patescibacteria group bacterium]|nr:hypothetical protein [Patescibacteria group bacterium]